MAFGAKLRLTEENTKPSHFAMQVRINCEDPQNNFAPNSGLITRYVSPGGPGVRIDSNLSAGYEFPRTTTPPVRFSSPMAATGRKCSASWTAPLTEYMVGGVKTTIPFYRQVLKPGLPGECSITGFIPSAPELMIYADLAPESERLPSSSRKSRPGATTPSSSSANTVRTPRPACRVRNVVPPAIPLQSTQRASPYPHGDRVALLDYVRDSGRLTSRTRPPATAPQSNSGNRFRLAEDRLVGPYLDNCGFFSL